MFIRFHHVDRSLERLENAEATLAGHIQPTTTAHAFRLVGDRLIREDTLSSHALKGMLGYSRDPGIGDPATLELARCRLRGERFEVRTSAYAIAFKSNIRAFYIGSPGCTLKVNAPGTSTEFLHNEIRVRQNSGVHESVGIPKLITWSENDSWLCLLEESIHGRRPVGKWANDWMSRAAMPAILDMYHQSGVELTPARQLVDPSLLASRIQAIAEHTGWTPGDENLDRFLSRIEALRSILDCCVLTSAGHGDLTIDNILADKDDHVVLLDWERAGRMTILHDLRKLLRRFPALHELVASRFRAWFAHAQLPTFSNHRLISRLHGIGLRFDTWQSFRLNRQTDKGMADSFIRKATRELDELDQLCATA